MKTRIILGSGMDPYRNLAFEESLVDRASLAEPGQEEAILFLWQNADTVVIGANQNPWRECNLQAMDRDGVHLTRRVTGGGAVFHDIGNLNFSFIVPRTGYDVTRQGAVIVGALAKVGIHAEQSGRNDILADGRKFSGNAFLHRRKASLHHGTLLIGSDMSRLANYLQVDPEKLSGKGVQSVRARVVNLAELAPALDAEQMKTLVAESFAQEYGAPEAVEHVDLSAEATLSEVVLKLAERNVSWEWLYGKTPTFTMSVRHRFAWGGMEIGFNAKGGRVETATVWSDCLMAHLPGQVADSLQDVPFHAEALAERVFQLAAAWDTAQAEEQGALRDIAEWLRVHPL